MSMNAVLGMNFARLVHGEGRVLVREIALYATLQPKFEITEWCSGLNFLLLYRWRMRRFTHQRDVLGDAFRSGSAAAVQQFRVNWRAGAFNGTMRNVLKHRPLRGCAPFQRYRDLLRMGFDRWDVDIAYLIEIASRHKNIALLRHLRDEWWVTSLDIDERMMNGLDMAFAARALERSTKPWPGNTWADFRRFRKRHR